MSFQDPAFLFGFLPVSLLLFLVAGRAWGSAGGSAVLILSTLLFCIPYGWPFLALVAFSALINHVAFFALIQPAIADRHSRRKIIFIATLVFNLGILAVVKYGVLFQVSPGAAAFVATVATAIPVTISFFTFQRAVMLFDAYQRRPETLQFAGNSPRDHLQIGAFNLMFPNLVIGPIAYVSELGPQLARSTFGKISRSDVSVALTIIVIGLGKKMLIADPLDAHVVSNVFGAIERGQQVLPVEAAVGMLAFYAQLYFDFSGYSDIAIGIARLFGLVMPINFNSPLRATGIVDFYKRWHITLTRVIARLLFTPLAVAGTRFAMKRGLKGTRFKLFAIWLPFLLNFEVIGLWHGAKWTFVVFGIYQGVWYIMETEIRLTRRWKAFVKRTSSTFRLRAGQILTLIPLVVSFAIFRSHSMSDFGQLMASFGGDWLSILHSPAGRVLTNREPVIYMTAAFSIIWFCPNVYEFLRDFRPGILTWTVPTTTPPRMRFAWRPTLVWAGLLLLLGLGVINSLNAVTAFVYGGF